MGIVDEEERTAFNPPHLQPGLKDCIGQLLATGLRLALVTRNSLACVNLFLKYADVPEGAFSPIVTRDSGLRNMPDPAPMHHCCTAWGANPATVLSVGETIDVVQ